MVHSFDDFHTRNFCGVRIKEGVVFDIIGNP